VTSLTLLSRQGCHLCDEARAVLDRVGVGYVEVDIESDDELLKRWLERIPVVMRGNEVLFELFVEEEALRARLE
jgi:glutaredoxin